MKELIQIQNMIYNIRGYKVMLDSDLAMLYEVETKVLNQAVKRNIKRFPEHYMFQLTSEEWQNLRSQFVTSESKTEKRGGRQYYPYVFTEQGVAMLSSVLRSEKAIQVNIQIIDTFVKMRQWVLENKELAKRLSQLEHYFIQHCNDDKEDFKRIYDALGLLMDRTKPSEIGFKVK